MNIESGWTAEALDNAIRRNLELQGEFSGDLMRLDAVPFELRNARYRKTYSDLIEQLDELQAEYVRLNRIEPMR